MYNVLDAQVLPTGLVITYALPAKSSVTPTSLQYPIDDDKKAEAQKWVNKLLGLAYKNTQQRKRLKVLLNPFGGQGKAVKLYEDHAARIFAAARCELDVQSTEYRGHATDIAEKIDINSYDAIITCSGDGLPYEVINGLGKRPNAKEALAKLAVGLLPGGSACALTLNSFGSLDVSIAALGIVKGIRTPMDLVSVSQKDTRVLSFLSQTFGIIAEADLCTDHLRWMGDSRFTYGYLKRLMAHEVYPCDLAMKVEIDDKEEMKKRYAELHSQEFDPAADRARTEAAEKDSALPELKHGGMAAAIPNDWEVIPGEKLGTFMAGNMPVMSEDNPFFPAACLNDGMMDIIALDGSVRRLKSLDIIGDVPKGKFLDRPDVPYRKASAYRLVPRQTEGVISIDGESIPFEGFQCEVHQGLATLLTKSGHAEEPKYA